MVLRADLELQLQRELGPELVRIEFPGGSVDVEVVADEEPCQLGLMNRALLPSGRGMLFRFQHEARHAMWMRNMRFPLDLIYLSTAGRVTGTVENVLPVARGPIDGYPARYVLEVNAGWAKAHGVRSGQRACGLPG